LSASFQIQGVCLSMYSLLMPCACDDSLSVYSLDMQPLMHFNSKIQQAPLPFAHLQDNTCNAEATCAVLLWAGLGCAALFGAVLCCAVLCCAVLCCAVLCCAVLCCAVLLIKLPAKCQNVCEASSRCISQAWSQSKLPLLCRLCLVRRAF